MNAEEEKMEARWSHHKAEQARLDTDANKIPFTDRTRRIAWLQAAGAHAQAKNELERIANQETLLRRALLGEGLEEYRCLAQKAQSLTSNLQED